MNTETKDSFHYSVMSFGIFVCIMGSSFIDYPTVLIRVLIFSASVLWFCFSPLSRCSWRVSLPYRIWLVVTLVTGLCLFFMNLFFRHYPITPSLTLWCGILSMASILLIWNLGLYEKLLILKNQSKDSKL